MANPRKAQGTRWESKIRDYWKARGLSARRKVMAGNADEGDLCVEEWPDWTFEAKDRQRLDIPGALDEAVAEAANAGTLFGAAILKRKGHGTGKAFVVMDLETFTESIGRGATWPT